MVAKDTWIIRQLWKQVQYEYYILTPGEKILKKDKKFELDYWNYLKNLPFMNIKWFKIDELNVRIYLF